ncbi:hypothetical protein BJY52DRAFT_1223459 [Lactarius psammicola]|nr:hypothetical protein BJY52DRAFT_1223459 [Lactarius psammicola]
MRIAPCHALPASSPRCVLPLRLASRLISASSFYRPASTHPPHLPPAHLAVSPPYQHSLRVSHTLLSRGVASLPSPAHLALLPLSVLAFVCAALQFLHSLSPPGSRHFRPSRLRRQSGPATIELGSEPILHHLKCGATGEEGVGDDAKFTLTMMCRPRMVLSSPHRCERGRSEATGRKEPNKEMDLDNVATENTVMLSANDGAWFPLGSSDEFYLSRYHGSKARHSPRRYESGPTWWLEGLSGWRSGKGSYASVLEAK